MKAVRTVCATLAVVCALAVAARAADKEVTLKGTLVCAKCTLGETDKCTNALKVKDGDKTVIYYITDDGAKADYHKGVCPKDKSVDGVSITGVVTEKDKKMWIKGKVEMPK